jgi:hypothetical protein
MGVAATGALASAAAAATAPPLGARHSPTVAAPPPRDFSGSAAQTALPPSALPVFASASLAPGNSATSYLRCW